MINQHPKTPLSHLAQLCTVTTFPLSDMNVTDFVEARMAELETMSLAANKIQGNARVMQKLPRHMRRRAASHNIKRVPRRVRNIAEREVNIKKN